MSISSNLETRDMDTPTIRVPVKTSGGEVFKLDGDTTVVAVAKRHGGGSVDLVATITDADGGIITISVGSDDLDQGVYTLQVRVTKSGEVQTVVEAYLNVKYSIPGAA